MVDISSEQFREYVYGDDASYRIEEPLELHVTDSGSHRVIDANGMTHRPEPYYIAIRWMAKDGQPKFVA